MSGKFPAHLTGPGAQPWTVRPDYATYKSRFGPNYTYRTQFHGIDAPLALRYAKMAGLFGVSAGVFAFFFFAEVPRVRADIAEKIPILGSYFHQEIPPEDNPF